MSFVKASISRDYCGGLLVEYKFNRVGVEVYFNDGGETADFQAHLKPSQIRKIAAAWTDEAVTVHLSAPVAESYLPVKYYAA